MLQRQESDVRNNEKQAKHLTHIMLTAAVDRFGVPNALTIEARKVLMALDTAGVGPRDLEVHKSLISSHKPRFPPLLGAGGAGVVMVAASRLRRFQIGDWPAEKVGLLPKRLDLEHAAAIATTGLSALRGLRHHMLMQRSELVRGGSGALKFTDTECSIVGDERPSAAAARMSGPVIVGGVIVTRARSFKSSI